MDQYKKNILCFQITFSKKLEISSEVPGKAATSTTFVKINYMYYSNVTELSILCQHQGSYRMRLYESFDMSGQMHELVDDCPNVQDHLSMSDFNSCNVMDGHWLLYDQPNYKGRAYYLRPGEYRRYSDWGGISPRVGSLRRIIDLNWNSSSLKCIFPWVCFSNKLYLLNKTLMTCSVFLLVVIVPCKGYQGHAKEEFNSKV